ncbi:MAG: hypothetical protein J7605_02440 [Variovorax sp.]|nr:hypothetical protein [Variovorax sp.]
MEHSFSYKGRRIDIEIVLRSERFEWSFQIDGGEPISKDEYASRSSASAILDAMATSKKAIDRLA